MQQINLYQDKVRKKKARVGKKELGLSFMALIGGLILVSAVQGWLQYQRASQLSDLKQQQQKLLEQVQTISAELVAINDDSALQKQLLKTELELKNKQEVLTVLSGHQLGNTKGFAEQFSGLSRQHIADLWLTQLHIHGGGEKLNLQGSTFIPDAVPRYLQKLSNEPSFQGLEFKTFLMERSDASKQVNFDIRSTPKS